MGNHSFNVVVYDEVDYDNHFHKNYEFIYVMEGEALCGVNGKVKVISQGEFAFCLSNEIHSIKSIGKAKVWIGVFSEDFIREFAKLQKGKTGVDFTLRCSDEIMRYLSEHLIKKEISDIFIIKSCLYALLSEYMRKIPLIKVSEKKTSVMASVIEYIEKNYKTQITLATLARSLGYEYCYFSKLFTRIFSMSFGDLLNEYRFEAACAMLTESKLSISVIAYESGFQSVRSFNHTFKRLAGVSPSEWKNRNDIK
jgi:xylan 1,4-beta-xylosidase